MKFIPLCCLTLLFLFNISAFANIEPCEGTIRYADWENFTVSDEPVLYCYTDFETFPGAPIVNPIAGIFIPFFISTDAVLGGDSATYTGSTLSASQGTIYDFVGTGRMNSGEATKYIHFLNIAEPDLTERDITVSFTNENGNCVHELTINVEQDLPTAIQEICPTETFDCAYTFKIEYIDWAEFLFKDSPTAYCAEELSNLYPEANGTFNGGFSDADKPGVYIPFSVRSNAPESFYQNSMLSISNGAIYRTSEPPRLSDGTGSPNIYFMYLTQANLSAESITISFADSTNTCIIDKQINVAEMLSDINPATQCLPQNCGDAMCEGIETYANCPGDCECTGNFQFINWPSFSAADTPQIFCAEDLSIDSIGFMGGNTDRMNPGFYIPFTINTETLPNDNGIFESSILTTSAGLIYNATNPPTLNTDSLGSSGVHFLYLTQAQLEENSIQLRFTDSFEKCKHATSISVANQLPATVPTCTCESTIRFVNWEEKITTDTLQTYCAEALGDFPNWQSNIDTPAVFIPFVIQTGAAVGMDSITYKGSTISASAGIIYNSTTPPTPNTGQARVFIHLLALNAFDLQNETIRINFMDSTSTCLSETIINVEAELSAVQPNQCLEAECGNSVCEAVESYADCPGDCDCQGVIQFLKLDTWPNLVSADSVNAYCVEQLVPPGSITLTNPENPGVYIPFTIQSQAAIDSNNVYINSKINTNLGSIYNVQVPPTENDGTVSTVHYLFLSVADLETGGDVINLTFSNQNSTCVHETTINLNEDLANLNPVMQCLEFVCGDGICDAAETYNDCAEDCPCLGAIEFLDWDSLSTTPQPQSYCYETIADGVNPIDANNPGVFIPFRIKTNATLGEDSIYTNSNLQASTGVIYNNIEPPVKNEGTGSIYAHLLYISADDWERSDSTTLTFTDEGGGCAHQTTINFTTDIVDAAAPSDCYVVGVDNYNNQNSWLSIYPNPTNGILTVGLQQSTFKIQKIALYNIFGQTIRNIQQPINITAASFNLDVTKLSKGTYFIAAFGTNGQVAAKRFVRE